MQGNSSSNSSSPGSPSEAEEVLLRWAYTNYTVTKYMNIVGHSIVVLTAMVLLVILIVEHLVRKRQPLKSRGAIYYLAIIAKVVGSGSVIIQQVTENDDIKCILDYFFFIPVTFLFLALFSLQVFKYLLLRWLEHEKARVQQELMQDNDATHNSDIDIDEEELREMGKDVFESPRRSSPFMEVIAASPVASPASPISTTEATTSAESSPTNMLSAPQPVIGKERKSTHSTAIDFAIPTASPAKKRLLKLLQVLSSPVSTFILLFILLFIWLGTSISLFIAAKVMKLPTSGGCPVLLVYSSTIIFYVYLGGLILFFLALLAVDLITFRKELIRCRLKSIFIHNDPLLYRAESLIFFICATGSLLITYVGGTIGVAFLHSYLSALFRIVFFDFGLLMISPGFILAVAIKWEIEDYKLKQASAKKTPPVVRKQPNMMSPRSRGSAVTVTSSSNSATRLEMDLSVYYLSSDIIFYIFTLKDVAELFREFAKKEFSVENVLLFEDIQHFKRMKSIPKKYKKAKTVYHTYFAPQAVLEINTTQDNRDFVFKQLKEFEETKQKSLLSNSLFERCETAVIQNLLDTYSRFYKSANFQNYLMKRKSRSIAGKKDGVCP